MEGSEKMSTSEFVSLRRQQFRQYFQPSRIVLGILPAPTKSGVNVITLCFDMYCSYKPPMMAVAIQNINASYELIERCTEYVLAVPGPALLKETVFCGTKSMNEVDKVEELRLKLSTSTTVRVPGIAAAIANIELTKQVCVKTGDHLLCVGLVRKFGVNRQRRELPLLSIGPDAAGYEVLAKQGIHRIGTVRSLK
jgi:flavin reductase (DIM6/NTAB) family NADH-FMN oxidoreductase RutF